MSIAALISPNKNDLYAKSVYADNLILDDITSTNITCVDLISDDITSTNISSTNISSTDISCITIESDTCRSENFEFYPYNLANTLSLYYNIRNNDMPLTQLSNTGLNSNKVDVIYNQIGRSCMLTIIPSTSSYIVTSRRVVVPLPSGVCNIYLSEFGSDISGLIFDALEDNVVIQGSGYYLKTPTPYIRQIFTWSLQKGPSAAFSLLQLTKENFDEPSATPGWTGTDYLLSINISFCSGS